MFEQIKLRNILSFGPTEVTIELKPLNVIIGPNGSGKSNLIEAIGLLRAAPRELAVPLREGGGVREWLWKGADTSSAVIEVVVKSAQHKWLAHGFTFAANGYHLEIVEEHIRDRQVPTPHYELTGGVATLRSSTGMKRLKTIDDHPEKSILAQFRDYDNYPEITQLADAYERVRIYRDWSFTRNVAPRASQSADLPSDFLAEDASNLALVLSTLRRSPAAKQAIVNDLKQLYDGINDYEVIIEGGRAQLYLNERDRMIPATRLSDGTLRFLCLLCILHHPNPPPCVAIEEPELGLHPDILPRLAELLQEASARMQLIVTTHSTALVDALSDNPEAVLVAEKHDGSTRMTRLDAEDLHVWLEKYSLGELWTRGDLGGTRW